MSLFNNPFDIQGNDIAILELEEEVDLRTYTPVCLPEQGASYSDKTNNLYTYGKLIRVQNYIINCRGSISNIIWQGFNIIWQAFNIIRQGFNII